MRIPLIFTAAALVAFAAPAFAQSSPATPVMPAPNQFTNPNAGVQPPAAASAPLYEGRAAAPMRAPHVHKLAPR
jgi:hypothetical protein